MMSGAVPEGKPLVSHHRSKWFSAFIEKILLLTYVLKNIGAFFLTKNKGGESIFSESEISQERN